MSTLVEMKKTTSFCFHQDLWKWQRNETIVISLEKDSLFVHQNLGKY